MAIGAGWAEGSFVDASFAANAWDDTVLAYFARTVASDGGTMWPPRSNDPRWAQVITDSGITVSNNFLEDVRKALEVATSDTKGSVSDMWKTFKEENGVTDTSEPFMY